MNIPSDLDPSSAPPPGMPGDLDPSLALKKKSSKVPLIVGGVLLAGGLGVVTVSMLKKQEDRKKHAAFMDAFAKLEREEVGKFWTCVLGPNVDAGVFQDNLALGARITGQFGSEPKTYPGKVREECTPLAKDARGNLEQLPRLSDYDEGVKQYVDALKALEQAFDDWSKVAPSQVLEMEIGKKMSSAGTAWHAFESGKPDPEVIAFDKFLHCAAPAVDTMKDGQALVEFLFSQCKNPAYVTKLNEECGKILVADPPGEPTKGWQAVIKKLASDDRDMQAFEDCMRKGRKGKRRDDLAEVGKAWVAWQEAGAAIRKVGKEALKD